MLLAPIGWLYGKIADARNALYDRGTLRSYDLGAKTISIGNITAGGTGKTPLVAYVAEILCGAGEKVCILTRGYGRESSGRVLVSDGEKILVEARTGGDEPTELARKLIGKAIVVADADRVAAAAWAKENFAVTAFVLDDAFQHRRARRDLEIVCVDATSPLSSGRMLPAGNLREPIKNLSRAHAIVVTRADLAVSAEDFVQSVRKLNPTAYVFLAEARFRALRTLDAFLSGTPAGAEQRLTPQTLSFCGLGNPKPFLRMLANEGTAITRQFRDHHRYTQADIQGIENAAREYQCDTLVTTAKDAVKLEGLDFEMPCLVAEMEVVLNDPDGFRELVLSA
ncbi:MAG TPA: tetraacyldisaccharide 4'-kinase [Pyrinomonadaceae bacterium]|nr:tetraacyldisaccharide 4'-kinase [Pyrinomonadaceae bacterium]